MRSPQIKLPDPIAQDRGLAFVSLYASAKQLVDNHPNRFPYLQYWVRYIEGNNLAPKIEVPKW